ncbi:MAG: tetratricopeptide repeat protein, partial [Alphaproteobacteria bacterium]|nr:tetratricopeptide repeat protein [Alphaproteobacteria bacterium]
MVSVVTVRPAELARVSKRAAVLVALFLVLLTGCQEDPPAVSLEQAKKITASFAGGGFVAPPRSVNDILALLDQEKPDPAKLLITLKAADAPPPSGANKAVLANFYLERGKAAATLGRSKQQIDDLTSAYDLVQNDTSGIDYTRLLQWLSYAHWRAGNRAESVRYRKLELTELGADTQHHGRQFGGYLTLVSDLSEQGEIDTAKVYLERMALLLQESHRWRKGAAYAEFGPAWEAHYLRAQALIAERTGHTADAEALFRRELAVYDDIPPGSLSSDLNIPFRRDTSLKALANVLSSQNRVVEAEVEARQALLNELREHGHYAPETAEMLMTLAAVVAQQGRYADAGKLAQATIDIYQRIGHVPTSWSLAQARNILAMVQLLSGRPAEALSTYQSLAADIAPDPTLTQHILGGNLYYADALLAGGQTTQAVAVLKHGVEFRAIRLGADHPDTAEARGMLAMALANLGDGRAAMAAFREAVPVLLADAAQAQSNDFGERGAGREQRRRQVMEAYVALLVDNGESVGEAFRIADAARSQVVQKSLIASAARAGVKDPEMADLVRREQDAEQQGLAQETLLADDLATAPEQRDAARLAALRAQVEALHTARRTLQTEIDRRFPAYANLRNPPPVAITQAQAALREGEALVAILVGTERSFVWAVPHSGAPAFASVPMGRDAVARMVARLRVPMESTASDLGSLPAYDLNEAYHAYQTFLAPVVAGWKGARSLMVVSDKSLGRLPFSMLLTDAAFL